MEKERLEQIRKKLTEGDYETALDRVLCKLSVVCMALVQETYDVQDRDLWGANYVLNGISDDLKAMKTGIENIENIAWGVG